MKRIGLAILLMSSLAGRAIPAPVVPYPHSKVIREMDWHWDTYTNAAIGSDLWPVTWGPDDNLYAAWGDGGGFGGSDSDGRVAMGFAQIEGTPENWRGINVNGGKNPEHPASFPKQGKTGAMIFVHGILYASVNLQDGKWPDVNHELAQSTNCGATWTMAGWRFPKGEGNFQPSSFLNYGKDYNGVPESLAAFVYLYGVKRSNDPQEGGRIYLARVPTNCVTDHSAYEFLQGFENSGLPMWSTNWTGAKAIFTDPNNDGGGTVAYVPALKRYLLASFHDGPGQLGIFDSPNPWGPWTTVCYYENFGNMGATGEGLVCSFPQKWMSADGLTLWSIFSCYGAGAKLGIHGHDRLNVIKVTLQFYP